MVSKSNETFDSRNNCNAIIQTKYDKEDGKEYVTLIAGCKKSKVPEGVEAIGTRAFDHCFTMESLEIASTVKKIENDAFFGCNRFNTIYREAGSYAEAYANEHGIRFVCGSMPDPSESTEPEFVWSEDGTQCEAVYYTTTGGSIRYEATVTSSYVQKYRQKNGQGNPSALQ